MKTKNLAEKIYFAFRGYCPDLEELQEYCLEGKKVEIGNFRINFATGEWRLLETSYDIADLMAINQLISYEQAEIKFKEFEDFIENQNSKIIELVENYEK